MMFSGSGIEHILMLVYVSSSVFMCIFLCSSHLLLMWFILVVCCCCVLVSSFPQLSSFLVTFTHFVVSSLAFLCPKSQVEAYFYSLMASIIVPSWDCENLFLGRIFLSGFEYSRWCVLYSMHILSSNVLSLTQTQYFGHGLSCEICGQLR